MRDGLRSGKKIACCNLDDKGLVKDPVKIKHPEFGTEIEQSPVGSTVAKSGGRGRRGKKRKNVEVVSDAKKVAEPKDVQDDGKASFDGMQEVAKGRRGRRRKSIESSEWTNDDDDCDRNKMAKDCTGQVARRVLRSMSGTSEEKVNAKNDEQSLNLGSPITLTSKVQERNLALVDDKTDMEEDEKPQCISRPKKLKGRRGRPPKVNRDNGASGEEDFATEKDERPQKISKTEKLRGHCGRLVLKHGKSKGSRLVKRDIIKSRVQKVQGSLKVNTDKMETVMGSEEASSQSQTKSTIQCNESKKNGIREEKQLAREKIIHMLLGAGWTIDYRRRHGREYRDAVYVDCEKRTYWSVTLAYRKLKEIVESGVADSKAVSAFEPIPDEILSKLFRVTLKGKKSKKEGTNCNETEQILRGRSHQRRNTLPRRV